jgi:hypothetical protein
MNAALDRDPDLYEELADAVEWLPYRDAERLRLLAWEMRRGRGTLATAE